MKCYAINTLFLFEKCPLQFNSTFVLGKVENFLCHTKKASTIQIMNCICIYRIDKSHIYPNFYFKLLSLVKENKYLMQVIHALFTKFLQFFSGWISGLQQFSLLLFLHSLFCLQHCRRKAYLFCTMFCIHNVYFVCHLQNSFHLREWDL